MAKLYQILTAEYHSATKRDELSGGSRVRHRECLWLLVQEAELSVLPSEACCREESESFLNQTVIDKRPGGGNGGMGEVEEQESFFGCETIPYDTAMVSRRYSGGGVDGAVGNVFAWLA